MTLTITDPEAGRLARQLAARTGETITAAVVNALRERLERQRPNDDPTLLEDLAAIERRVADLPVLDDRTPDEIIGYDEHGLPGYW